MVPRNPATDWFLKLKLDMLVIVPSWPGFLLSVTVPFSRV